VPLLPPESRCFKHVCEEIRLDAWVCAVTNGSVSTALSAVTQPFVSAVSQLTNGSVFTAHSPTAYATNLANCFRDQVELVSSVENVAGIVTCFTYAFFEVVPFLMAASQGPAGICTWLSANEVLRATKAVQSDVTKLKHEVIELKRSLGALHGLVNQATS
jgi:hypothetical protein